MLRIARWVYSHPIAGSCGSLIGSSNEQDKNGSPAQAVFLVVGQSASFCNSRACSGGEVLAEVLDEVRLGLRQDTVNDRLGDPALWERKHSKFGPTGSKS